MVAVTKSHAPPRAGTAPPASPAARLVRLAVLCASCRHRKRRRVAAWRIEVYRGQDPGRVVDPVQCHKCRRIYPVTARAYLDAGP